MLKVLAMMAVLSAAAVPAAMSKPPQGTPAANHGCDKSYTYKAAKRGLRKALKHHYPMTQAIGATGWKYVRCARTRQHQRWLAHQRKSLRAWRRSYAHVWQIRFHELPATWQQWAWDTGACESGNDPTTDTGNGFEGAFQWVRSTWYDAGGYGSPTDTSWYHQAVLAVRYAISHGTGHWPNCP